MVLCAFLIRNYARKPASMNLEISSHVFRDGQNTCTETIAMLRISKIGSINVAAHMTIFKHRGHACQALLNEADRHDMEYRIQCLVQRGLSFEEEKVLYLDDEPRRLLLILDGSSEMSAELWQIRNSL